MGVANEDEDSPRHPLTESTKPPEPPTRRKRPLPTVRTDAKATPSPLSSESRFPIVGLGASAGGLKAFGRFLANVPPACGLAFVVVQHLDPTHKGILAQLLQRDTAMPVVEIEDRMTVRPDHVYVIPPNQKLSIERGVLFLREPTEPRGHRLAIDSFFRSLAQDQQECAVGVVLSGMGSDGTLGLRAIQANSGATFVQTPTTAEFDSMPHSAMDAGVADMVAPAEELPGEILDWLAKRLAHKDEADEIDAHSLQKILAIVRTRTGHDFSPYKKTTVCRRIDRRKVLLQLPKLDDYIRHLRHNPQEVDLLFREMLIGVTNFFRDPAVWDQLRDEVLPELLSNHAEGTTLRAWIPACSTGEEAYSLAMVFREAVERLSPASPHSLLILATDLAPEAIDHARAGVYPAGIAADVGETRLRRFFVDEGHGYRVAPVIRAMVVFAAHDLTTDPPFIRLDLLMCRNLLIYLEAGLQKKLLPVFHHSLNPGGVLVLGNSETTGRTNLFTPIPGKTRIYRRQHSADHAGAVAFPVTSERPCYPVGTPPAQPPLSAPDLRALTDALLLRSHCPAAVLTTASGDIVYISGKTGRYLDPAVGKANINVFAMARPGLGAALMRGIAQATRRRSAVLLKAIQVESSGTEQILDITVDPLEDPAAVRGMFLIVFTDVGTLSREQASGESQHTTGDEAHASALLRDLNQSRWELRTTHEQMQAAQEEQRVTNEELQSTNEELQGTNEEMTSAKEELQSMNEEMQTVNGDMTAKLQEALRASDDLENLLDSTDIATVFLDSDLGVRRFTKRATKVFRLIPGDIGRPLTDLVSQLDYPGLAEDAREVLRSLVPHDHEADTREGDWFRVRIAPYRTQNHRVDGLVITFVDISSFKSLEETLREALSVLQLSFTDQATELGAAKSLEVVLRKAQEVLERRLAGLARNSGGGS